MDDLISALTIFRKYGSPASPTHCERDTLNVMIDPAQVSADDLAALAGLGFNAGDDGLFYSFRFGSA